MRLFRFSIVFFLVSYFRRVSLFLHHGNEGRMFVALLGYPPKCQQNGVKYSCTLSFACWLVGGSLRGGCGSNAWLVACCVIPKMKQPQLSNATEETHRLAFNHDSVIASSPKPSRQLQPPLPAKILKRMDFEDEFQSCGLSADRILSKRIIGGDEAQFGQFPWQAFIKIATYQCGGVLVSHRFVATAAHCIIAAKLKDTLIYLGELDTQDTGKVTEMEPAELHRVRRRIIHPAFQFRTTQPDRYDLALLEMVTPAVYSYHIVPICLPDTDMVLIGRDGVIAGWGKVHRTNELTGTNVLRSATVPILAREECMSWHKIKQIEVELHEEMICAGHKSGKHDACLGDSGGPLIILEKGRWTLAGITSAGFGCGEPHQPGIYHKIPASVGWIRSVIQYL